MAARSSGAVPARDPAPVPSSATGWTRQEDLAGLEDQALLSLVRSLPRASGRRAAAYEVLVIRHQGLVRSCVWPYLRSPEPAQDLMQAGYVGLLKAISSFDQAVGASLPAYARPYITGELKHHFRDRRWPLYVKRPIKELVLQVRDATEPLTQELGRTPTEADLARHLGVSGDELRQARQAQLAFQPASLDAPLAGQPGTSTLTSLLGEEDTRLEHMLSMHAVATHWGELAPREQQILLLSFGGGMTQVQIGQQLHISQMHVSRLRARALGHLRSRLLGLRPAATPAATPGPARRVPWPAAQLRSEDRGSGTAGGVPAARLPRTSAADSARITAPEAP